MHVELVYSFYMYMVATFRPAFTHAHVSHFVGIPSLTGSVGGYSDILKRAG